MSLRAAPAMPSGTTNRVGWHHCTHGDKARTDRHDKVPRAFVTCDRHCPVTCALLENIPSFMSDGIPFAFAFFSVMPGGTGASHVSLGHATVARLVHRASVVRVDGCVSDAATHPARVCGL